MIFDIDSNHSEMSLKESGLQSGGRNTNRSVDLPLVTFSVTFNPALCGCTWKSRGIANPKESTPRIPQESMEIAKREGTHSVGFQILLGFFDYVIHLIIYNIFVY